MGDEIACVQGGITDLIMSLEDAQKEDKVYIYSHFKQAKELYAPFVKETEQIYYDSINAAQTLKFNFPHRFLPKRLHPNVSAPKEAREYAESMLDVWNPNKKKVIGVHPVGSRLSNQFWAQFNQPLKYLPKNFLGKIMSDLDSIYLLFGAREDLLNYASLANGKNPRVFLIDEPIWHSLAFVEKCDLIIGVDSAIKGYSAIKNIPTICLVGDYEDPLRDEVFLLPYVKEGIMHVIKFRDLNEQLIEEVNFKCKDILTK